MTTIVGNDGGTTWPTTHGGTGQSNIFYMWRLDIANTVTEVTGFGNANLRSNRGGLLSVSGSVTGSMDSATASKPAAGSIVAGGSAMTFTASASKSWSLTALISNISPEVNKRDNTAVITYDIVAGDTDTLSEAW